ncbi:Hint domain-containing protein [Sulfitobacter sp. JB4-11]|uniref:Hint domain-containing protein n=1 Tax=Sulfitobacter rhodophyticola TaxID=3238304 RepID=UPI0035192515
MADNVNLSAIYLGSFADIDTDEGNSTPESPNSLLGTYGSPANPLSQDRTIIDSDSTDDFINVDHAGGGGTFSYDVGGGPTTQVIDTMLAYSGSVTFADGSTQAFSDLIITQMQNGDVFLAAHDSETDLASQPIDSITLSTAKPGVYSALMQSAFDDVQFVCYAAGTLITTGGGEDVKVEDLRVGDMLFTADHGPRPIRWIGQRRLCFGDRPHKQKPIEIKAGRLGGGLPRRRLIVSPQHRLVIGGPLVQDLVNEREAFVSAKGLTGLDGIRVMQGKRDVTYYSLLCDRHEVIRAEGAWSETFYPGVTGLKMVGPAMRRQIESLFPALRQHGATGYGPRARRQLNKAEATRLVSTLQGRNTACLR